MIGKRLWRFACLSGARAQDVGPMAGADAISVPQLINYQGKLTDADGCTATQALVVQRKKSRN